MLGSLLLWLAVVGTELVSGSPHLVSNGCKKDACYSAVLGRGSKPCKNQCKSFMRVTVTPRPTTVFKAITATLTSNSEVVVKPTETILLTVTETKSIIKTDLASTTRVITNSKTATATETITTTTTEPAEINILTKRLAQNQGAVTKRPTKIPANASACTNTAAFSSACSCIGVHAKTIYARRPTVTSTKTRTATTTKLSTKTKEPVIVTVTDRTDTQTTTYTTTTITTTVATEEVDTVVATDTVTTVTTTTTTLAPPPKETFYLKFSGSPDPAFAAGGGSAVSIYGPPLATMSYFAFGQATSQTRSAFTLDSATGVVTARGGPQDGFVLTGREGSSYYAFLYAPASISPTFSTLRCSIRSENDRERLECKFSNGNNAEFRTVNYGGNTVAVNPATPLSGTHFRMPELEVVWI